MGSFRPHLTHMLVPGGRRKNTQLHLGMGGDPFVPLVGRIEHCGFIDDKDFHGGFEAEIVTGGRKRINPLACCPSNTVIPPWERHLAAKAGPAIRGKDAPPTAHNED